MFIRKSDVSPIGFDGLLIHDYTEEMNVALSVAAISMPPAGGHAEAYSKRSDKYYVVVDGEVEFSVDGRRASLGSGDFCFVARGSRFGYRNTGPQVATLVVVHAPRFSLESEVFVSAER